MSYILDALRRADAEREQGAVPSLHSKQVAPALAEADEGEARGGVPISWVAMGASALVGAVLVWFFVGRSDAPEPAPMVAAAPPPPAVMPAPPPPQATVQPQATPYVPPPVPMPAPAPAPAPLRTPAATPAPVPHAAEPKAAAKPSAKAPAPTTPTPAVDENAVVPSMAELPDDIRRQLPQLTVSGATYSKTASSRMLILNGQIFHEGDKVANDLVLEQVRLKSAVLSFRGTRYSISY